ncbi:MAG: prohibitin family protein, partial [Clostridia bacterium]|nr:prohibitin family protein [Clostridia bacterium]
MPWIIVSILVTVVLFVVLGKKGNTWKLNPKQYLCLLGLLIILAGCVVSVPTGHTGILVTFGHVENQTLEAGVHMKLPYQEVIVMDNRNQKASLTLSCFSKDIQEVEVKYSINYQINKENAQNIYKDIGADYYHVVMEPRIQNAVKTVTAKFTAETLIESRSVMAEEIQKILVDQLAVYNIQVLDTAVENMDFSDALTNAVEAKQVAAQNKLQAEIEQAQKTMEEEAEAARATIKAEASAAVAKIQAEADLEVTKIQADAAEYAGKKDAAKNEALAKSLTEQLIRYYEITTW